MPSAPKQIPLFIPRQIMLQNPNAAAAAASAEKKKRKEEKKARKLSAAAAAPDPDVVADGGGGKTGGKARKLLLISVCGFLESSGFEKTLAVFRSEAEIPIDGEKASALHLEDLFCKFLESRSSEDAATDRLKERDMKISVPAEDAHAKKNEKEKKRKPILNPDEENNEDGSHGKTNTDREHDLLENDVNNKEKQKKKSKMPRDTSDGKPGIGENGDFRELVEKKVEELKTLSATPAADSNPKPSGEKRKKTKRCSDASAGNAVELETEAFQERITKKSKESVTVETSIKDALVNADSKSKDKKKKKDKTKTEDEERSHDAGDFHKLIGKKVEELKTVSTTPSADANPETSGEKRKKTKRSSDGSAGNAVELETEAFQEEIKKKSKESVTVEASTKDVLVNADSKSKDKKKKKDKTKTEDGEKSHDAVDGDDATAFFKDASEEIINNSKKSKKRKQLASEERALEPENVVEAKDSKHARLEGGAEDTTVSKKQKKEKNYENSCETVKTSYNENIDHLTEHKENPGSCESPKQSKDLLANGDLEKESEEGTSSKMLKKEKHSAEPTTNSFRRVKLEEVEFVDERLQNNSYWAKGGADSGYGAKAQEILGQVRGRDFRHEKTKKKRGSYRGGQIDLQSHSIKFNYSDEE